MVEIDNKRRQIVKIYIQKNDNCTKTDVINYMRGHDRHGYPVRPKSPVHSSQKTTEKILKGLTCGRNPEVVSSPDPNNSSIHRLHLNDRNLYNQIDQILSDIETKILRWNEPIDKLNKLGTNESQQDKDKALRLKENYVYAYYDTIGVILRHLPTRIKSVNLSKKDAEALYEKVMHLNKEFNDQILGIEGFEGAVTQAKNHLLSTMQILNTPFKNEVHYYVKSEMLNDLMKTLESFYKQFSV